MLDNERYNDSLRSIKDLINGQGIQEPDLKFQALLKEQYKTQKALQELGINKLSPPDRVPHINEIIFPKTGVSKQRSKLPLLIEVGGMPRSGKTTVINGTSELFGQDLDILPEPVEFVKRKANEMFPEDLSSQVELIETAKTIINLVGPLIMLRQSEGKRAVVSDRDIVDQKIFEIAFYLRGIRTPRTNEQSRYGQIFNLSDPHSILEEISTRDEHTYALIICITNSTTSLSREAPRPKPGTIVNELFLSTLYEQYLRFHNEILHTQISFPYALLDLSGNQKQNQNLFNSIIQKILTYYKR